MVTLYPRGEQYEEGLPVYQPDLYTNFLGQDATQELVDAFAGGILAGHQVRNVMNPLRYGIDGPQVSGPQGPEGGLQYQPLNPSGIYDTVPNGQEPVGGGGGGGDGAFNALDIARLSQAMGRGNWGNAQMPNLGDVFEDAGGGTFNLIGKEGTNVPAFNAIDWMVQTSPQTGLQPWEDAGIEPEDAVDMWVRALESVDMSA